MRQLLVYNSAASYHCTSACHGEGIYFTVFLITFAPAFVVHALCGVHSSAQS